jgi:hypothetical protein
MNVNSNVPQDGRPTPGSTATPQNHQLPGQNRLNNQHLLSPKRPQRWRRLHPLLGGAAHGRCLHTAFSHKVPLLRPVWLYVLSIKHVEYRLGSALNTVHPVSDDGQKRIADNLQAIQQNLLGNETVGF